MIDVTVKTLDGRNRNFSVRDDITVKEFKEHIASEVEIPPDRQRIIHVGKVLQDEKKLDDYKVHGKCVHLVQRMVPRPDGSSSSTPRESTSASRDSSRRRSRTRGADDLPDDAGAADGYFLGAFTVPTNDAADPQQIQNIIQEQLQQLGGNAQVSTRTSPDGGSVDVHINLGTLNNPGASRPRCEATARLNLARRVIEVANRRIAALEGNPEATTPEAVSSANAAASTTVTTNTSSSSTTEEETPMAVDGPDIVISTVSTDDESSTTVTSVTTTTTEVTGDETTTTETIETTETTTETTVPAASSTSSSTTSTTTNSTDAPDAGSQEDAHADAAPGPPLTSLASALSEILSLQQRFRPHLESFRDTMAADAPASSSTPPPSSSLSGETASAPSDAASDGATASSSEQATSTPTPTMSEQRRTDTVLRVMHDLSHAYHALSDVMVDMTSQPPRHLHAPHSIPSGGGGGFPMIVSPNMFGGAAGGGVAAGAPLGGIAIPTVVMQQTIPAGLHVNMGRDGSRGRAGRDRSSSSVPPSPRTVRSTGSNTATSVPSGGTTATSVGNTSSSGVPWRVDGASSTSSSSSQTPNDAHNQAHVSAHINAHLNATANSGSQMPPPHFFLRSNTSSSGGNGGGATTATSEGTPNNVSSSTTSSSTSSSSTSDPSRGIQFVMGPSGNLSFVMQQTTTSQSNTPPPSSRSRSGSRARDAATNNSNQNQATSQTGGHTFSSSHSSSSSSSSSHGPQPNTIPNFDMGNLPAGLNIAQIIQQATAASLQQVNLATGGAAGPGQSGFVISAQPVLASFDISGSLGGGGGGRRSHSGSRNGSRHSSRGPSATRSSNGGNGAQQRSSSTSRQTPPGDQSSAGSSTGTTPTTATRTRTSTGTTSGPQPPAGMQFQLPEGLAARMMGGGMGAPLDTSYQNGFDPFMPCLSRHRVARRSASGGGEASATAGSASTTANSGPQQRRGASRSSSRGRVNTGGQATPNPVADLISSILQGVSGAIPRQGNAGTSTRGTSTSTAATTSTTAGAATANSSNNSSGVSGGNASPGRARSNIRIATSRASGSAAANSANGGNGNPAVSITRTRRDGPNVISVTQVTIEPIDRSSVQTTSRSATTGSNSTTASTGSAAAPTGASATLQPDVFSLLNSVVSNQPPPNIPQRSGGQQQQQSQSQQPWTDTLRTFLAGGRGESGSATAESTTAASPVTPASEQSATNRHDNMFVELLSTFSNYLAQQSAGNGSDETIASLFNRVVPIFGEGEGEGGNNSLIGMEGLLGELVGVIFNRMQFMDLLSVYTRGDGSPLNFLRPHLRAFVDERLLRGREPSEENLREAIMPLVEDIVRETGRTFDVDRDGTSANAGGGASTVENDDDDDPPMPSLAEMTGTTETPQDVLRGVTVVRGVDFHASLRQLYEARCLRLIATIYDDGVADDTFGAIVYAQLCQCIHDFVGLTLLLTSGEEDLRTVVTNIIRVGFRDHNPLVIEWIVRICGQHLREVVDGLHVIHEELNSFVVASGAEGTPNKAANANVAKLKAEDEPMEAEDTASMEEEECWSEAKESLEEEKPGTKVESMDAEASTSASKDHSAKSGKDEQKNKSASPKPPPASADVKPATETKPVVDTKPKAKSPEKAPERPTMTAGARPRVFPPLAATTPQAASFNARSPPSNWEPLVPPEWVAIIQQDVQRQQSVPPQPPFSDAYLNGMPANKRRKTLHLGSPDGKKNPTAGGNNNTNGDSAASSSELSAALPDAVRRAIVASGARSTSGASAGEVARQVAAAPDVGETFVSSVEATIRRRLADDPDFKDNPNKFPSTKKMFEEKDKGPK